MKRTDGGVYLGRPHPSSASSSSYPTFAEAPAGSWQAWAKDAQNKRNRKPGCLSREQRNAVGLKNGVHTVQEYIDVDA